jgi:hypothetical protein
MALQTFQCKCLLFEHPLTYHVVPAILFTREAAFDHYIYIYIYMLSTFRGFGMCLIDNEEESMTFKLENMIDRKSLMSKVGIITLVSASLRSFCPISSLITSCSLTPSYFGNSRVFPSLLRKKLGSHVHVKRYRSVAIRGSIIL